MQANNSKVVKVSRTPLHAVTVNAALKLQNKNDNEGSCVIVMVVVRTQISACSKLVKVFQRLETVRA